MILTVDDDPAVSRAVARDLRRHYGENYRIVRAESGPDALETLNELKLRGDTVAVFVADYRMPQMSGIEFLEEAMDIYPLARRVLLTAYADTHAAIEAINVVDLDHYLLKPWDPPEEKLYPVIDALLDAWQSAGDRVIPHTKIIGHPWNARSSQVREFLARNQLYYTWFRADEPDGQRLLEAAGEDGLSLPVVITEQGTTLVDPTDAELAATLGLTTTPAEDFYDLVVIGGGPAGLAAAVYGASEGLRTVLIERTATGGQAGQSSRIENYLGFPDGMSGAQLADRARRQAVKFDAELITAQEATALDVRGAARTVKLSDGRDGRCTLGHPRDRRVVPAAAGRTAATGCTGAGVHYGAALSDRDRVRRRGRVHRRRRQLGRPGRGVPVQVRQVGDAGRARSVAGVVDVVLPDPADRGDRQHQGPHVHRVVKQACGDDHLERLILEDQRTGQTEKVTCGRMFVFIGAEPRTDWLDGVVARDDHGFVLAGPDLRNVCGWTLDRPPHHLETSVPGVFVAGDVRAESAKRVAAAVGEGSMAVMLVHRYLAEA